MKVAKLLTIVYNEGKLAIEKENQNGGREKQKSRESQVSV